MPTSAINFIALNYQGDEKNCIGGHQAYEKFIYKKIVFVFV